MSRCTPRVYGSSPGAPRRSGRSAGRSASVYTGLTSMPESVKRRGSPGPTIGATVRRSSVAMGGRLRSGSMSMTVTVRLFAILRQRAGRDRLELELPDGARVADALRAVDELAGGLSLVMAVNREYAAADQRLEPGDELALIPPVSGGAPTAPHVAIREDALSLDELAARVRDPRAGAVVVFEGVTRDVGWLDYEAYAEMAGEQMQAIVGTAIERHGLCAPGSEPHGRGGGAAEHRVGRVPLSEPSVIVAASAPHRGEAFAGAREIIDEIKARAPIWKGEGGEWVEGAPPPAPGAGRAAGARRSVRPVAVSPGVAVL